MRRAAPNQLGIAIALIVVALFGASYWIELNDPNRRPKKPEPSPDETAKATAQERMSPHQLELIPALKNGQLAGAFSGNGLNQLSMTLTNLSGSTGRTVLLPGLVFTAPDNAVQVVCTGSTEIILKPGTEERFTVPSAALRLRNTPGNHVLLPSETRLPSLEPLWPTLTRFPDATPGTIQTAILLLTEDPTLAHFAKFALSPTERPKTPVPETFKTDTQDIILALVVLSKAVPEKYFKLIDSAQLRLEALIDARAHDAAIVFYNIDPDQQRDFWRTELAHGDPSTRHYALYGIARYYPDLAYEMLPKWIIEPRTPMVYRQHAAYALAEIPRPEALRALVQLQAQVASEPDIRRVVERALVLSQERQPVVR